MGGKVVKPAAAIVRRWNENWQLWTRPRSSGGWICQPAAALAQLRIPAAGVCAVPARQVMSACFWVEAVDNQIVTEMAALEMDVRGIAGRERLTNEASVRILFREETRTLVQAVVFPSDWLEELSELKGRQYEPSPILLVLADQAVHLWREGDDLVAAVTWRGKLLCWETMHWTTAATEIADWLRCFLLQVRKELGVVEEFSLRRWNAQLPLPLGVFSSAPALSEKDLAEGPLVKLPDEPSTWLPPLRRLAEEAGRQRRSLAMALAGLACLILTLALAGGFFYWKGTREIQSLDARISEAEREAAPFREAAERWSRLEAAVDHRHFSVEILHHLVAAIPASGVRLTVFETSSENVLVEGEAKNVSAATEFFANIRGSEGLQTLSWEMPPPSLQANNTARFIISGARADAE